MMVPLDLRRETDVSDQQTIRNCAHDLRNNLHAIEMLIVALEDQNSPSARQRVVETMKEQIAASKQCAEALIALARDGS